MEYHALILNRTFLVLIAEEYLIGIKSHGLIGVEIPMPDDEPLPFPLDGGNSNPYTYINMKYIRKIRNLDLVSDAFLKANSANFKIKKSKIISGDFDKRKKWGMGPYPHDGKVYLRTEEGAKREFIIMGSQSGKEIAQWITEKYVYRN